MTEADESVKGNGRFGCVMPSLSKCIRQAQLIHFKIPEFPTGPLWLSTSQQDLCLGSRIPSMVLQFQACTLAF